jgi:hypothetical protein
MTPGSQTDRHLEDFGSWGYPRVVGTLVVCGAEPDAAAAHVRSSVRHALTGGLAGGTEGLRALTEEVLGSAKVPPARPPAGPVETALAALPWADRVATVGTQVLGVQGLGPGRPDEVARSLGARTSGWAPPDLSQPDLATLLAEAVDERAPAPLPSLVPDIQASMRRRRITLSIALAVLLLIGGVLLLILATRDRGGEDDGARLTSGSITQWVAVLEEGPTPASLAPRARELGRIVGVYVFTDKWACYEGFGADTPRQEWFLGLASNDKETVDGLVEQVGVTPLVEARVAQTCVQQPPSDGTPVVIER